MVRDSDACSCGSQLIAVAHDLDMVELLITAQALTGLVTVPPNFEGNNWDIDLIQADIDARDEAMSEIVAMQEVTN
jgi:hypothetical protein